MKNKIKQEVCIIANTFIKQGVAQSIAFIKAWAVVKGRSLLTKVKGVTFGNSQKALQRLLQYNPNDIIVSIEHDKLNLHDSNAIAVNVGIIDKGVVKIGYLPSQLAKSLKPILDMGIEVKTIFKAIRGAYKPYMPLGIEIELCLN